MKTPVIIVLLLSAITLLIWTINRSHDELLHDEPRSVSSGPGSTPKAVHQDSIEALDKARLWQKYLGIHSELKFSAQREQFMREMAERYNSIPRISVAQIKKSLEAIAASENAAPENVAVEMMFTVNRAFLSGTEEENYPILTIVEAYGSVVTPLLLDRLEWQNADDTLGGIVLQMLKKIEKKDILIEMANKRLVRSGSNQENWRKVLEILEAR